MGNPSVQHIQDRVDCQARIWCIQLPHLPQDYVLHALIRVYSNVKWMARPQWLQKPFTSINLSPFITSRWRPGGGLPALKANNWWTLYTFIHLLLVFVQSETYTSVYRVWLLNKSESFDIDSMETTALTLPLALPRWISAAGYYNRPHKS